MSPRICAFLCATASVLWCLASSQTTLVPNGTITISQPGLINMFVHRNSDLQERFSILAATYDLTENTLDESLVVLYPGATQNLSEISTIPLSTFQLWPKEIHQVPGPIFDFFAVSTCDGSLIEGKTAGTIWITNVDDIEFPATFDIIQEPTPRNYMYTDVIWENCDNLGGVDILTCRAQYDSATNTLIAAEFVAFIHPEEPLDPLTDPWPEIVLKEDSCDTNIVLGIFQGGEFAYDVVYATGYYTERLIFLWPAIPREDWTDPEIIAAGIIETGAQYYDIGLYDIDNDGGPEVLVTEVSNTNGAVAAWKVPDDFREVLYYEKHILADGFAARHNGEDGRAPGIARAFRPSTRTPGKPWILLTGGDDGRAYYLEPLSEASTDWTYTLVTFSDHGEEQVCSGGTSADIDGNGLVEIFISFHNTDEIEVYTFTPSEEPTGAPYTV